MSINWLKAVNWVDILFVIIIIRIIYIAARKKLVIEFFKFLGILFSILLGLHYYDRLAKFIAEHSAMPLDIAKVVSYIVLIFAVILVFKFILEGVLFLFKIEPRLFLDRWVAILIGLLRGVCICSLIGLFFLISTVNYLEFSLRQSFLGNTLVHIAPRSYDFSYRNIISKVFPNESLNQDVFDTLEGKHTTKEAI